MQSDFGDDSRRGFARENPDSGLTDFDYTALRASLLLDTRAPELSAVDAWKLSVPGYLQASIGIAGAVFILQPGFVIPALSTLFSGLFVVLVAWRVWLLLVATTPGFIRSAHRSKIEDSGLPIYSILVPLYDEAATVPRLAEALSNLDWPAERLDIILLTERGDVDTIRAVESAQWPGAPQFFTLPPGAPQTKPRALNYGLQHARGTLACIYDAEDCPHPNQLQAAHAAFLAGGPKLACVQAPLAAYNHRGNWLSLQWASEYAVQFGLLLPALGRLKLPILLGGTSNHFKTSVLRRLHGWDAWNVTEDADLGVRLARRGMHSKMITPPTFEEAPETLGIWMAQRSRWLKGFWQTWVVMMRSARQTRRDIGLPGFVALQIMLVGTCLAALMHAPLMLAMTLLWLFGGVQLPFWCIILLAVGYGSNALAVLIAPGPRGMQRGLAALTLPLYWPLHSFAAARALYGWLRSPHFWAKTPHGLTAEHV